MSRMNIWIVETGEPIPLPCQNTRLFRMGMVAQILHSAGHKITWWSATFDHAKKTQRCKDFTRLQSDLGYQLLLLPGCAYMQNVCFRRLINHAQLALGFGRHCRNEPPPGVILCAMPTIELCYRVGAYARRQRIPFIVDIRDLWPDIYGFGRGRAFRAAATLPIFLMNRLLLSALRAATGLTAVSDSYLNWGLAKLRRAGSSHDRVFKLGYDGTALQTQPDEATRRWVATLGLMQDRIKCWFVGTFGQTYNVRVVVEAARILRERRDMSFQFILSGTGMDQLPLRKQAVDLDNILLTGWLDRNKLFALMPHMQIGIAAYAKSAPQSIPNKIGEYACAGVAILCSLRGETADMISKHNCGIAYDADDTISLVTALQRLAHDPALLATMRKNARKLYAAEFDSQVIYRQMADHVEKTAETTRTTIAR